MGRALALIVTSLAACSFKPGAAGSGDGGTSGDGAVDAAVDAVPDAGPCQDVGAATCTGDLLRTCTTVGQVPDEVSCAWGCGGTEPAAHCNALAPAGGWAIAGDTTTGFEQLADVTLPNGAVLDTDTGAISGADNTGVFRAAGTGVVGDIEFAVRAIGASGRQAGVFRFRQLTIGNLALTGTNAVVLIADEGIAISGVIDGVPACAFADTRTPGPGGFAGGNNNADGLPTPPNGGGIHGPDDDDGGGGGGHGAQGGDGGNNSNSGGGTYGDPTIPLLLGGAGGGGGDDHAQSGRGGGGGAAIHLIANGPIAMKEGAGINAGGCGGRAGKGGNDGGGGGGAGGTILIEAPEVTLKGTLAVNGGGGGGGNTGADTVGEKGQLSRTPAAGGPAGGGSAGGAGGAGGGTLAGAVGTNGSGGGGGGGVGRIRINTRGALDITDAILSPGPNDMGTTFSSGTATVN